ncbi:MAG: hypothetical protein GY870_04235, partial [archaeon]|nr:hypothetical protein [archaeon]
MNKQSFFDWERSFNKKDITQCQLCSDITEDLQECPDCQYCYCKNHIDTTIHKCMKSKKPPTIMNNSEKHGNISTRFIQKQKKDTLEAFLEPNDIEMLEKELEISKEDLKEIVDTWK